MLRIVLTGVLLLSLGGCLDLGGGGGGGGGDESTAPPAGNNNGSGGSGGSVIDPDGSVGGVVGGGTVGGGDGGQTTPPEAGRPPIDNSIPVLPELPPLPPVQVAPAFAEPAEDVVDERASVWGFYDEDAHGQPRLVRNDLTGTFSAMLQLVQSHSVDPQGNEAKHMPRLASEREALLLVTPDPAQPLPKKLTVTVDVDGARKGVLTMAPPSQLPWADPQNTGGRPDVVYSKRAWSAVLPWDWVVPGMRIELADDQGRSGSRESADFDFGAPAELVLQAIQLGMLTDPPNSDSYWFIKRPAQAATDYFQTLPVSKIISGQYEPVKFPRVMVASGVIYDSTKGEVSATDGGYYNGDMRENTGKATVSTGINLANWGVTSAGMSQQQPQLTETAVMHHALGAYKNGVQPHGLSGGNGILTLVDGVGNEFSHEIGHHYGLGHYPGATGSGDATNYFWSVHHHDSGWGYIAYRKRMRANLNWVASKTYGPNGMPVYKDTYAFNKDAMAGGNHASALSSYTQYTGYSTQTRIQPHLDRAVWSSESPTGYRKWNPTTRKMEDFQPTVPKDQKQVWYNAGPSGNYLRPRLFGVPVFTILGGYDPVENKGVLYPALRGNWGNVFDLPAPLDDAAGKQCWLKVDFADGRSQRVALAPTRMWDNANQLHVQLAQAEKPAQATLQCRETAGSAVLTFDTVAIPQNLPPMPAPVVVGREQRFNALRAVELPGLQAALEAQADKAVPILKGNDQLLYDSYRDNPQGLSVAAQTALQKMQQQENSFMRLNRWLDAYGDQLAASGDARTALDQLLVGLQLDSNPLLPAKQGMTLSNGNCVHAEQVDGSWKVYTLHKSKCTGGDEERWRVDATNRIRNVAEPSLCLTSGNPMGLTTCNVQNDSQSWDMSALPRLKRGNQCMDQSGGMYVAPEAKGSLIMYSCSGGENQKWLGLTANDNGLLALLKARNLRNFIGYAEARDAAPVPPSEPAAP